MSLKIMKGGRLFKGDEDITDALPIYLSGEHCELEDGVTLKDVFKLVKNSDSEQLLSPLLTNGYTWLGELLDEGLNGDQSKCEVDEIVVGRSQEFSCWDGVNELDDSIDVSGVKIGDEERYGLDLTPTNELMGARVVLDKEFKIYDVRPEIWDSWWEQNKDNPERKSLEPYPVLLKAEKGFTLLDILGSLFYELSFMGSPVERIKSLEGLKEQVKDIEEGKAELIPWEEVKKELGIDDREDEVIE